MKAGDPRLWLSLASLAVVIVLVVLDLERATPGPLTPVHATLPELAGAAGCAACHGRGDDGMAGACATCHAEIGTQLANSSGFHGGLPAQMRADCALCHVEHHGDELELVGEFAFRRAGVAGRDAFVHDHVPFGLVGAHTDLACSACHTNADTDHLARGDKRFLGLSQECASCHADPHAGAYSNDCATCHGQEHPFTQVANFNHGDAFPLTGAHARAGCAACHPSDGPHAIGVLATRVASGATDTIEALSARDCASCHTSPHSTDFVSAVANVARITDGAACALCHDARHPSFVEGASIEPAQHALTGFPLDGPHAAVACDACHERTEGATFEQRFAARAPSDCAACHEDPHGDTFAAGSTSAFAGAACSACHGGTSFEPHAFGLEQHTQTRFALTGAHTTADCSACHVPEHRVNGVLDFAAAEPDCASCHTDAHGGSLVTADGLRGQNCAACHGTESFTSDARTRFDHSCTGFAIDGAHTSVACESCHVNTGVGVDAERVLGRIPAPAVGSPDGGHAGCAGCHTDVHFGSFDAPRAETAALQRLTGDRAACARCHTTADFAAVRFEVFDHGLWTGFALDGAHDAITCAACHGAGDATRALGRVHEHFKGSFDSCATCHADPHGGRFERAGAPAAIDGRTSCARCHTSSSFRLDAAAPFEHALWTGFALEGAHAAAACTACHVVPRPDASPSALGLVRGAKCADCHADPHVGQFASAGRTDCARCHTNQSAFDVPHFDHSKDTRFALDAQHAQLDCNACHRPVELPGGLSTVRYKPLGTACIDCHAAELGGGR